MSNIEGLVFAGRHIIEKKTLGRNIHPFGSVFMSRKRQIPCQQKF